MKKYLKLATHGLFIVLVSPMLLLYLVMRFLGGTGAFAGFSQLLSLVPGKTGSYCRIGFYRFAMSYCHYDCVIGFGTVFSQSATRIGRGVYIGPQCNIGSCEIEEFSLIASGVHIMSGRRQHNFDDLDRNIQEQGGELSQVRIGADSWVGNGALIMANVGTKVIIGAGSVVSQDVPDYAILVGNPAKIVKFRR